jgi:predicted transcriptional regulator
MRGELVPGGRLPEASELANKLGVGISSVGTDGGGMFVNEVFFTVVMEDSSVMNNNAKNGGGVHFTGTSSKGFTMVSGEIAGNTAVSTGGGS